MANRVSSPIFIGRRRELDRATAALARARAGEPAVLLVAGEAGVGKTRFVQEVARHAQASGFRVLQGGSVQLGGEGLPFAAIIEAFRNLPRQLSEAEVDRVVGSGRAALGRLLPDLEVGSEGTPDAASFDASAQGRLFEHLLRLLARLAESTPLILVAEDIHWADRSTLELINFLARNVRDQKVVLAATYRSDELHRLHPLLPFLAEIERSGRSERLTLARFDRGDVGRQLEGIIGTRPDSELVERVLARSEGNAFYTEELLAADASQGRLPDSLREVLLGRVATLGRPTQDLLRNAAAAGSSIAPDLPASVLGHQRQDLDEALREAVARQVLVPEEGGHQERYRFRHALIQEALDSDLLPGERASLHRAFARALAAEDGPPRGAQQAAELAFHWQAAHDMPRAFDAWIRAGIAAEAIYAFTDALGHFERALDLWDQVPDAAARAPLDRVDLLMRVAAAAEGPAIARAVAYVRKAIALVDPAKDPARAGLLHERLGYDLANAQDHANALAAYRQAVALVPAEPPSAARAHVLAGLGFRLFFLHHYDESMALCNEALRVARAVGDRGEEGRALIPLSGDQVVLGDVEAGLANVRRAREVAAEVGDVYTLNLALTWTAGLLILAGQYEAAIAAGFKAAAYAVEHGLAARFGVVDLLYAAWPLILLGRWDEGEAALDQARTYGGLAQLAVDENQLVLEALRGRYESAGRMARDVRLHSDTGDGFTVPPGLAELALLQGDPGVARRMIRDGMGLFDAQPEVVVDDLGWACWLGIRAEADLAVLARAAGSQAELDEARSIGSGLLARIRAMTEQIAARRPYYTPHAEAWLAICEAESSRLEGAPDPDAWAPAAKAWDGLGTPYFQAYSLMREAEAALGGRRDRGRAAQALTASRAIAVRLGAEPLRMAVEALALRAGGKTDAAATSPPWEIRGGAAGGGRRRGKPQPDGGAADRRDGMTPRERDVLALVAGGRSDGEIAQALFITKKTASSHVAHIKDKLKAQSRVEIAVIAIGLGLVEVPPPGKS